MDEELRLLGYCGLYCGACYHYRSSFPESRHVLEEAVRQGKDPEQFTCGGCRGEKERMYVGCVSCAIRTCAEKKGIIHCGICSSFPCDMLLEFQHDEKHIHHLDVVDSLNALTGKGPQAWLQEQRANWRCTCGLPFSWYERRCAACGSPLHSYGTDLLEG
jgi:hypothetical protein